MVAPPHRRLRNTQTGQSIPGGRSDTRLESDSHSFLALTVVYSGARARSPVSPTLEPRRQGMIAEPVDSVHIQTRCRQDTAIEAEVGGIEDCGARIEY